MKITIQSPDIKDKEAQRALDIIFKQFDEGVFNIRNGKAVLNFDSDGTLQTIEFNVTKWRRNKESMKTLQLYEDVEVSLE